MFKFWKQKSKKKTLINGFDEQGYLEANPDVKEAVEKGLFKSGIEHLEKYGLEEIKRGERKFHPDFEPFNEERYLELFNDVNTAVEEGLFESGFEHFCKVGYKEIIENKREWLNVEKQKILKNRDKKIEMNIINEEYCFEEVRTSVFEIFYNELNKEKFFEINQDIKEAIEKGIFKNLKSHLLAVGLKEIKNGKRLLFKGMRKYNEDEYKKEIDFKGECDKNKYSAFECFLLYGYKYYFNNNKNEKKEKIFNKKKCVPHEFDEEYYLSVNEDVLKAGIDPFEHYINFGEKEGRKPNPCFDPIFYLDLNPDLRGTELSPFIHYQNFGRFENRLTYSPYKRDKRNINENPILFIGHDGIYAGSEMVLLEIIKWFYFHTRRRIKTLLLAPGPLANQYAKYSEVYVLKSDSIDDLEKFKNFLNENFEFVYLNTVVSGKIFEYLNQYNIEMKGKKIAHIHEMKKVLNTFSSEMNHLIENIDYWISASPLTTKILVDEYKISSNSITTIPAFINPVKNAINIKEKARKDLGLSLNSFIVAGCGTVYWRKGPDIFIEVAKKLKKITNQDFQFVWIGDGPDLNKYLKELSEEEKKYIKFVGSKQNANEMLAVADLFFLSSREDPFPLVVLESAQYGVPTICFSETTGITDFIQNDAGISLSKIDIDLVALTINNLMQNKELLKKLGEEAKERLFSEYTSEKQCFNIYNAIVKASNYKPSVSVIVPFYNHEKYVEDRLNSILSQSIKDIQILIFDDCSTDGTVEKIKNYLKDPRISFYKNAKNSGSPFKQWIKGVSKAESEIIWIAEGDDFCDENFLEVLLPEFDDQMVNIASAKTVITNEKGEIQENALKPYLDRAFIDKFSSSYKNDGFVEINEQLGAICTLVNASGLLIRKKSLGTILEKASKFKMVGDWLVYLECLKKGKISYKISTQNYFRRHAESAVHKIEGSEIYFKEREEILRYVFKNYKVKNRLIRKAFENIEYEWDRFSYKHPGKKLDDLFDKNGLLALLDENECNEKYHVAFYVHGMLFSKGGIEKLAANLANHLVENDWKVTIYCRSWGNLEYPVYPLYESVNIMPIFNEYEQEESIKKLKKHLLKSDVDVFIPMLSESLFESIITAAEGTGIPILASEHNDPWKIEELWWNHEKRIEFFEKVDMIHILLNRFRESLPKELNEKVVVIPNGVDIPKSISFNQREKIVLGVGRLVEQKRFDRLIEAVSIIQNELRRNNWKVHIYGEGYLCDKLQNQIFENNVGDIIFLKGVKDDMSEVYKNASFFVMPSEFEGFGIALVEAMSYGLPAIAFKNCNGPNEIIRHEIEGYLVNDVEDMSKYIKILSNMKDSNLKILRKNAYERAKDYSLENFYTKWKKTLKKLIKRIEK